MIKMMCRFWDSAYRSVRSRGDSLHAALNVSGQNVLPTSYWYALTAPITSRFVYISAISDSYSPTKRESLQSLYQTQVWYNDLWWSDWFDLGDKDIYIDCIINRWMQYEFSIRSSIKIFSKNVAFNLLCCGILTYIYLFFQRYSVTTIIPLADVSGTTSHVAHLAWKPAGTPWEAVLHKYLP